MITTTLPGRRLHARHHQVWALTGWIALTALTGAIGALATMNAATFYATLDRPAWAPPSWLFSPVWTMLYLLMGVAAWMVWRTPTLSDERSTALQIFGVQLVLNAFWSWLFFAWHEGAASFVEIVVLVVSVGLTANAFRRVNRTAALLLIPYLAWVTFAAGLTYALWRANPMVLG